jgi:hypothetical protein
LRKNALGADLTPNRSLALSAAIFLILELAQPFGGVIRISSEPMLNALNQLEK